MMPKRLAEPGSDATDLERRLLAARVDPKPSTRDRRLVWERLIVGLAAAPDAAETSPPQEAPLARDVSSAPGPSPVLMPTPWTPMLLSGGVGIVIGVAATIGYFALRGPDSAPARRDLPNPVDTAAAVTASPAAANPVLATSAQPPPAPVASVQTREPRGAQRPTASGASSRETPEPASVASRLREEATLLRQAREQLGRGALAQAAASLAESRSRFPDSRLLPERDALTIELLMRQGRNDEAAASARVFLTKYPHSPHALQVTRALETRAEPKPPPLRR